MKWISRKYRRLRYIWSSHIARLWINRVRLPILLVVVSWTGKMNISMSAFAPKNLVSRDGFGSPVPRQPAHLHTQAESGAYLLRDSSRVPRRRPFLHFRPPYAIRHRVSPVSIGSRNCLPMAFAYYVYNFNMPTSYQWWMKKKRGAY